MKSRAFVISGTARGCSGCCRWRSRAPGYQAAAGPGSACRRVDSAFMSASTSWPTPRSMESFSSETKSCCRPMRFLIAPRLVAASVMFRREPHRRGPRPFHIRREVAIGGGRIDVDIHQAGTRHRSAGEGEGPRAVLIEDTGIGGIGIDQLRPRDLDGRSSRGSRHP